MQENYYNWNGHLSVQAEAIITQHKIQAGLTESEAALVQWAVFTCVHRDQPLSFFLYLNLLDKILKSLQSQSIPEEDARMFWDSTKKLLPSCFAIIRKIRKRANDKNAIQQLIAVLKILSKLMELQPPAGTDLFPISLYPWLTTDEEDESPNCDFIGTLTDAVVKGVKDWFNFIIKNNEKRDDSEEETLIYLNKIIQLVRSDLQKAVEYYDKLFQE